jgi:signal peptidase
MSPTTINETPRARHAAAAVGGKHRPRMGRVVRTVSRLVTTLCLATAVVGFLGLAVGPHLLGYRTTTMLSGSMSPHIKPGDVLVDVAEPVSRVTVGQVLTIQTPTPTHYVDSHRVVEVIRRGGHTYVRTQGDANTAPDPWLAELHGQTVWRVRAVIPHLGRAIIALRSPLAHLVLIWVAVPLLVVAGMGEIWRRPRPRTGQR